MRVTHTRAAVALLVVATIAGSACTRPGRPQPGTGRHTLFGRAAGGAPAGTDGESVTLDAGPIDSDTGEFDVDLPDGRVTAQRDSVIRRGPRDFTWFGRTPGRPNSNVTVTVKGDEVSAHVETDSGSVAAHSTGRGVGWRTRLDPNVLREESDPEATPEAADGAAAAPEVSDLPGDTQIDVLIVFNSSVARSYGTGVQAVAQRMIDKANKSFTDSQIRLQYRLVGVQQVADADIASRASFTGRDNMTALRTSAAVARLRDQTGADLVQAWGNYPNVCGQGYQPSVAQNPGAGYGFSVINNQRSCIEGQAVSHELGHNLGGGHDRITSNRPTGGGDAFGMIDRQRRFLTIMGYPQNCGSGCVQTWTFSNPNVMFNGAPTGVAGSIDNARVINIIGPRVAAFRAARV